MADWNRLSERYKKLSWEQRVGNLASTLARSATASSNPRTQASVSDLLREGMWIIEWTAPDAPVDVLVELAAIQLELGLLRRSWGSAGQTIQPILAYRTRAMSQRALELAGLAEQ